MHLGDIARIWPILHQPFLASSYCRKEKRRRGRKEKERARQAGRHKIRRNTAFGGLGQFFYGVSCFESYHGLPYVELNVLTRIQCRTGPEPRGHVLCVCVVENGVQCRASISSRLVLFLETHSYFSSPSQEAFFRQRERLSAPPRRRAGRRVECVLCLEDSSA